MKPHTKHERCSKRKRCSKHKRCSKCVCKLDACKVKTKKLEVKCKSDLCGETTIKGVLDLSHADIIPAKKSPLLGWWLQKQIGNFQIVNFYVLLHFVEDENAIEGIACQRYSGSVGGIIREWTQPEVFDNGPSYITDIRVLSSKAVSFGEINNSTAEGGVPVFTIQDNERLAVINGADDGASDNMCPVLYYKLDNDRVPEIIATGSNSPFTDYTLLDTPNVGTLGPCIDTNSPISQFTEIANIFLYQFCPQFAEELDSSVYPGLFGYKQLIQDALTDGYGTHVSTVTDIWPSNNSDPGFSTTIFTDVFHQGSLLVKVNLSFDDGSDPNSPYRLALEGDHRMYRGQDITFMPRDLKEIYDSEHYDYDGLNYMFNVHVDTTHITSLNRRYDPEVDGAVTVTVQYEPITEDCSPSDYYAAFSYWMSHSIYQIHTYTVPWVKGDRTGFESFSELIEAVNSTGDFNIDFIDTRFYDLSGLAPNYYTDVTAGALSNDKYQLPRFSGYHVPVNNYLTEAYELFWSIDPNTPSDPNNFTGQLKDIYGYPANGSRFMYTYGPLGSEPTFPYPGSPQAVNGTDWRRMGDPGRVITFGQVRPELTGGKNIAYIQVPNEVQGDPNFFLFREIFQPDGSQGYPNLFDVIGTGGSFCYAMAIMMDKIKSFKPDKIIFDTRTNSGGNPIQTVALACYMGEDRPSLSGNTLARRTDTGFTPLVTNKEYLSGGVDCAELNFPFTVQVNQLVDVTNTQIALSASSLTSNFDTLFTDGDVVINISTSSASAGDTFTHYFLGADPNNSRDMGNNVNLIILGNIDGRLDGGSTPPVYPTTCQDTALKFFGDPYPYFLETHAESVSTFQREGYESIVNQIPQTIPDQLLNAWYADSVWNDTGVTTPHPQPPLAGWVSAGGIQEITGVTVLAVAGLNDTYFLLESVSTEYYVWYNVNSAGTDPALPGKTGIEVTLVGTDNSDTVAVKTLNSIGATNDFWLSFETTSKFRITNKVGGLVVSPSDVSTGFTITQIQASSNGIVGQPITSDKSTWRDLWLELSILA